MNLVSDVMAEMRSPISVRYELFSAAGNINFTYTFIYILIVMCDHFAINWCIHHHYLQPSSHAHIRVWMLRACDHVMRLSKSGSFFFAFLNSEIEPYWLYAVFRVQTKILQRCGAKILMANQFTSITIASRSLVCVCGFFGADYIFVCVSHSALSGMDVVYYIYIYRCHDWYCDTTCFSLTLGWICLAHRSARDESNTVINVFSWRLFSKKII